MYMVNVINAVGREAKITLLVYTLQFLQFILIKILNNQAHKVSRKVYWVFVSGKGCLKSLCFSNHIYVLAEF